MQILDTSAILSGKPLRGKFVVPPAVDAEIEPGGPTGRTMAYLRSAGLEVRTPGPDAVEEARRAAEATGDLSELSEADVEVVALAVELEEEVVSDDYRIQNVLRSLDLDFTPVTQEGIEDEWSWSYQCRSCGRGWEDSWEACPVCGGEIRPKRSG